MKRAFGSFLFLFALVGVLSVSAAQNVVSLHKGYTLSPGASQGYPDEEYELTNGKYGTPVENGNAEYYYQDPEYVGFRGNEEITLLLDLGESYSSLWTFEVGYLREEEVGIHAPARIACYLGDTEEGDFAFLGELTPAKTAEKAAVASLNVSQGQTARFVKVVITPEENAAWTFLDEISVLQGQNPATVSPPPSGEDSGRSSVPPYGDTSAPQTGDSNLLLFVLLCGISAIGTFALLGRRRFG